MANYDRGVYEPSDEVRVFDGSEDDDEDIEGSRLPLLIVLALLVLAMFGGVVWLAYTQGVARGRGETPILTAASGPERVAPPQGGGANTVPYQGFKIYEQPAPPDDSADNSPPAGKPAAAPAAAPVVAQAPPPSSTAVQAPKPAQSAAPKMAAAAPAAKPTPAAPPKSVAALIQQANSTPVAQAPKPSPAPAARQAAVPVGGPATAAPRQLGAMTAAPSAVKTAAAAPTASGSYVLQIGAYKSQADADAAWKVYKARHAALLSAYSNDVQQADLGEKGIWYRLRIGGFADRNMATSLCDRLKADGGACILGR